RPKINPNERSRKATFVKRSGGIKKKVSELSTLCGVPAFMIIYGDDNRPITWPENKDYFDRVLNQYLSVEKKERQKQSLSQSDILKKRS
ncbi:hypothetical protein GIB67_019794, partial [Kingdonia uniflora]